MKDLKIKVDNEAESKEAQELFFELGCYWNIGLEVKNLEAKFLYVSNNLIKMGYCSDNFSDTNYCEITLPELRDMVVLKRNDATHEDIVTGGKVLQLSNKIYYWQDEKWNEYPCGIDIKPIEKKEIKEYLEKQPDGTYSLVLRGHLCKDDDIEIPEGADKYVYFSKYDNANFYKGDFDAVWQDDGYWDHDMDDYKSYCKKSGVVLWQRPTQPEALPFIDDNPQSLNDQYAEIEQVRQHNHYFKDVSGLNEIDVYMVLKLFNVTDPCLQHIAKKALCAGQRGHKDFKKDLQDILDTAKRAVEINNE